MSDTGAPLLESLTPSARTALIGRSIQKKYAAGQVLWSEGDTPAGLTLVTQGKVRIVRGVGGRQTVIHSGEAGSTLGEIPFFTKSTYPATAIASEPTTCLIITFDAFHEALRGEPSLALVLLERLSRRVQTLVDRIGRLSSQSVVARLASFIIERSSTSANATFSLGMTQGDLAEELGTVREVVVRALRDLKNSGAIAARERGRFVVADPVALRAAAEPAD
ncbi:MAG: Crp/Fnr family transcriptional regulator [Gemmatimonadaceae bacterium]